MPDTLSRFCRALLAPPIVPALLGLMVLVPSWGEGQGLDPEAAIVSTDLADPQAMMAADLFGDPTAEVVVTASFGRVMMLDGATGAPLVTLEIPGRPGADNRPGLTAPVVGDFFGEADLEIAFGTSQGEVYFLHGPSLRLIGSWQGPENATFTHPPSVHPLPDPDDPGTEIDVVVIADRRGRIFFLRGAGTGQGGSALVEEYRPSVDLGAALAGPVVLGNVRAADRPEFVAPREDGSITFIDPFSASHESYTLTGESAITSGVILRDLDGSGSDEVIYTYSPGLVAAARYDARTNRMEELVRRELTHPVVSDPVLAGAAGSAVVGELLFVATSHGVSAFRVNEGLEPHASVAESKAFSGIKTHLAVIPSPIGRPRLVFSSNEGLFIMKTDSWFDGRPTRAIEPVPGTQMEVANVPVVVYVRDDAEFPVRVFVASRQGRVIVASHQVPPMEGITSPWMSRGATPWRGSVIDMEYHRREARRAVAYASARDAKESELQAALDAGDYATAMQAIRWLQASEPLDPAYQARLRSIWVRKNLLYIILTAAAVLALAAYIAYVVSRFVYLRNLEGRARSAVSKGRFDEAEELYEKLHGKLPRNLKVNATLAMVYMARKNYTEKTATVYSRAHHQDPSNANLLHAYARALLERKAADADAQAVYEKALRSFPEPALMEYAIGRCHKEAGRWDEAARRLRAALRGGLTRSEVYAALCDVYLETGSATAKALPVFRQQFQARQEDSRFLKAYLAACIDAKQGDESVESLCHQVLDLDSNYVPAYCHLATIYLQRNETGRAAEEVQRALEYDPSNEGAVWLLAQTCLLQGRRDTEAQDAYRRALRVRPDEPELLKTLSDIYFSEKRFDADAVDVFKQAYEVAPNDIQTLRALAETARLAGEPDLAIRSIEALNHLGHGNKDYSRQLAKAYIQKGVYEPRTEAVFREALRADPDSVDLAGALARVLAHQQRDDIEAIPVYELYMSRRPDDEEIGIQLARAYVKNNRYSDASSLASHFLHGEPGNEELQRLVALASLYDNKIDDAINDYEGILERNPNDREAIIHLAEAYAQKHRTDEESARAYQRALELDPQNTDLHLALASVHLERDDAVKAVDYYQTAFKSRPNTEERLIHHMTSALNEHPGAVRVRWLLCEILVAYGRLREALEQLQVISDNHPNQARAILGKLDKILAKDGKNAGAWYQKGLVLERLGDVDDARKALEQAYALQPNSPDTTRSLERVYSAILEQGDNVEVRFQLARLHYLNQDYDKAIGGFQRTAQDYRWEAESTKMLGKCFSAKGMLDIALQEYKKLVVDEETKELLYDLAQKYEAKKDLVGAKTVYRQLFAADIGFKDVKDRFEMLSGSTSDPIAFEKTAIVQQMSESAIRRYELLDELGRGAMGIVYRARDKELDEVVALKILPDSMSNNPEAVHRFKVEARNARKLSHPNIVRIHDIGEEMGRKYISMELVEGTDLKKKIRGGGTGRLDPEDIYRYGIQIADALAYAHRLGIVHRDIKPANIMLTGDESQTKVTDFGIAKMLDSTGEGTMVGAVIGTPLYMSPEQVQGQPVDNRADIYAFGIMLYEFANGRPPFTEGDLAYQHIHKQPERPAECPDELWEVISKCLAKAREDRWENAEQIVEALRQAQRAGSRG